MGSAKKNAKMNGDAKKDEDFLSPDIWVKDVCNICQDTCYTKEAKVAHCKTNSHQRKAAINKFFTVEVAKVNGIPRPSKILERFKDKGDVIVGLDSLHELVFPFCESGWWACSLCNDAGHSYDQIEDHVRSLGHLKQYIDEFHPAKSKNMEKGWSPKKKLDFLTDAKKRIYDEMIKKNEKPVAPEIILLPFKLEDAKRILQIDEAVAEYTIHMIPGEVDSLILQCSGCHEVLPIAKGQTERVWTLHKATPKHQRFLTISEMIRKFNFERVLEEDRVMAELNEDEGDIRWKTVDKKVYGPVCGISYLYVMGGSGCQLCSLCGCECENVDEHFSSEYHLLRFFCAKSPVDGWRISQKADEVRRRELIAQLKVMQRENDESYRCGERAPDEIKAAVSSMESESMPHFPPPLEPFGFAAQCFFCPMCWQCTKVDPTLPKAEVQALWNEHVESPAHIEIAARRTAISFEDAFFVPIASTIKLPPTEYHGSWKIQTVDGTPWKVQTQTDVGLEYVVEDLDKGEAVCTLCARSYPLGKDCKIVHHVRSYAHLQQYMHVMNRTMLALVLETSTEKVVEELMMDWLQRDTVSACSEIRVYSEKKTKELAAWKEMKLRSIELSAFDNEMRDCYDAILGVVDATSADGANERMVTVREALQAADMRIISMSQLKSEDSPAILMRCGDNEYEFPCQACGLSLVTRLKTLEHDVFIKHIGGPEHRRRLAVMNENKLTPAYFARESSTMTVKPFIQKDPIKKVTWRWNPRDKSHDLVLSIVGLDEVVERKSDDAMVINDANEEGFTPHFFCRVCAITIVRRVQALEDHVRSAEHVISYVNKRHPETILQLDRIGCDDGGKERRRVLATLLKDVKPPADYCIPVYDPVGEVARRQTEAELKQRLLEQQRKTEEARQKAMEERKKKDEERRKQREEEMIKEKEKMEEFARRQALIKENELKLSSEKERLLKIAIEKANATALANKRREQEMKKTNIEVQDPKIRALLDTKEQLAAQLEKLRAAKALPEPKLVIPGRGALAMPPPSMMVTNTSVPPPIDPLAYMPSGGGNPYGHPPPLVGPNVMTIPPPSLTVPPPGSLGMGLVGPKPVLPTYVPKVDAMPVYPTPNTASSQKLPDFMRPSLMGAPVDYYASNPQIVTNRQMLVDFMWKQGTEQTPEAERPVRFSRMCAATPGLIGIADLYEVVCLDDPMLTTFYCSMCSYWSTPHDMLQHMVTSAHRMAFLFRNYKLYHRTVESEVDSRSREILIEQFAVQIQKRDQPPPVITCRLKCYLNKAVIERLWPMYKTVLDHSWIKSPACRTPSPPRRGRRSSRSRSRSRSYSSSRSYSRSRSRSRGRYRSRSRRHSRSRTRSRSDSRGRRRSYSRSRSRTRSPSPMMKPWDPMEYSNSPRLNSSSGGGIPDLSRPPPGILHAPGTSPSISAFPPGLTGNSPSLIKSPMGIDMSVAPSAAAISPVVHESPKAGKESSPRDKKDRERSKEKDKDGKKTSSSSRDKEREREREKKTSSTTELMDDREIQRRKAMERLKEVEREQEKRRKERREREEKERAERKKEREKRSRRTSRSPSPSRKRRRSSSRERRLEDSNGPNIASGVVDWDQQAAAFLAKIGDLQGANKLMAAAASSAAASGSPQINARPTSGMAGSSPMDTARPSSPGPAYSPIYEETAPPKAPDSAEVIQRKMLGVLVAIQREAENGVPADDRTIDRICKEIGLPRAMLNQESVLGGVVKLLGGGAGAGATQPKPQTILQEFGLNRAHSSPSQQPSSSSAYGAPPPSHHPASLHHPASQAAGYGAPPSAASAYDPLGRGAYASPRDYPPQPAAQPKPAVPENLSSLLMSIKDSLSALQNQRGGPPGGLPPPRDRLPPPGYERDRRDSYGSTPPSYVYPGEEDRDLRPPPRRLPPGYDPRDPRDPRDAPLRDPRDPRADPRMMDPRDRLPPPPGYARDPRYDPRDARDPRAPPPLSRYDDPRGDPRDPRDVMRDPRDPRAPPPRMDSRERLARAYYDDPYGHGDRGGGAGPAPARRPPGPPGYEPYDRPPLTRAEYEERRAAALRAGDPRADAPPPRGAPASRPDAAAAPPHVATGGNATALAAPKQAVAPPIEEITIDDDWDSLEEMFDASKKALQAKVAAAQAGAATAAAASGPNADGSPAKASAPPPAASASGAGASPAAAAAAQQQPELSRQEMREAKINRMREAWKVTNRAEPQNQAHLLPPSERPVLIDGTAATRPGGAPPPPVERAAVASQPAAAPHPHDAYYASGQYGAYYEQPQLQQQQPAVQQSTAQGYYDETGQWRSYAANNYYY